MKLAVDCMLPPSVGALATSAPVLMGLSIHSAAAAAVAEAATLEGARRQRALPGTTCPVPPVRAPVGARRWAFCLLIAYAVIFLQRKTEHACKWCSACAWHPDIAWLVAPCCCWWRHTWPRSQSCKAWDFESSNTPWLRSNMCLHLVII